MTYRAVKSNFNDSWNIETEFPCINGLSAWFTIAVCHEADPSELGYTDGAFGSAEERANKIVAALNKDVFRLRLNADLLIDNAATASQNVTLLDDPVTREAVKLNVIEPLQRHYGDVS